MSEESYNAHVVARRDVNDSLMILRVGKGRAEVPQFEPGQFSNLGLFEPGDESRLLRRAFSIASPSSARDYFEFYIQRVDHGAFTTRLWGLKPGDSLWLDPNVYGHFTLADVPATADLILVATGSGVGPFLSMLREYDGKQRWKSAALIHSARHVGDLGYHAELQAFAAREPDFRYVPTLTREPLDSGWSGLRVRVQKLFEPEMFRKVFGRDLNGESSKIFICGNPEMITQLSTQLAEQGLRPHRRRTPGHIHTERYW
ncbi:MAG TPA: ferredoxin--NADP reductase [Planctomycetota bacterium]|nr:ferredoxin--NADP reductase [Planctomycetota bacterium]